MKKISFHGVPRSGTTWVGAIFDSSKNTKYLHQPLFSYAFKSFLDETSSKERVDDFFDELFRTSDEFVLQKQEKENKSIPNFDKNDISHVIYKEARYHNILKNLLKVDKDIRFVGIIRNPKSVLYSWYNAPKEFNKSEWNFFEEWRDAPKKNMDKPEEFYGYNKWKEVAFLFLELKELFPERVFILRYEDLIIHTEKIVEQLFKFCDLKLEQQTLDFLKKSKTIDDSKNAYSVFRKKLDNQKWQKKLPSHVVAYIDSDLRNTNLELFNE